MSKATVFGFLGNKQVSDVSSAAFSAKGTISDRLGVSDEIVDLADFRKGAKESAVYETAYNDMLEDLKKKLDEYEKEIFDCTTKGEAAVLAISGQVVTAAELKKMTTRRRLAFITDILQKYQETRIKAFEAKYSDAYRRGVKQYGDIALKAAVKKI